MPHRHVSATLLGLLLAAPLAPAAAQHSHDAPAAVDPAVAGGVDAAMAGRVVADAHLQLTPPRAVTAADSARGREIAAALESYLTRYHDVRVAEADGFRVFAPNVPQAVYHYTRLGNALKAAVSFDAARPTSLLYRPRADGTMELVGAMYTAPARASLEELDRRVPLGLARWHKHVNICVPQRRDRARWTETEHGRPKFGPAGIISTRAACEAEGGRFHEELFGWMVHADVRADGGVAWGENTKGHEH
ncbi:MAG TPA: hypothetical protein VFY16_12200 [Gemmatimonadaceae bacterium]|nr:hypothetical protein [Gemmatimonadaceae bacterium]